MQCGQWATAHDVIMPHDIPAGFLFCFSCFLRHDAGAGQTDKGAPASPASRPLPVLSGPVTAQQATSPPPFFVIGSHRGSSSTTGGVAGRLAEPWRQVFYGGWWMALLPYGHWRPGRPVLPRSLPEQVVAEVGYMSQNSHYIGNAKRQASGRLAQYSNARAALSCDPWFSSTQILYRGHLGWLTDPLQLLTAACGPAKTRL